MMIRLEEDEVFHAPPQKIKETAPWQSGYLFSGSVLETGHIVRITNQSLDLCRRNTEQQRYSIKQIRNLIVCPDSLLSRLAFQEYHLIFSGKTGKFINQNAWFDCLRVQQ